MYNIFVTLINYFVEEMFCHVSYKLVDNFEKKTFENCLHLKKYYAKFCRTKSLHFVKHIPVYFFDE